MSLTRKHFLLLLTFSCATMCFVNSDNINGNSRHLDVTSKSNVLKTNIPNVHEHMRTYLDVRKNNLLKKQRYKRKYRNGKFMGKQNFAHIKHINEKNILQSKVPLEKRNVLLIQNEKLSNDFQISPSHEMNIQSEISKGGTQSIKEYIQNPLRKFLETQVAKKSLNPLEEVTSQQIKLLANELQKSEPCSNKRGCKQKSHLSKREYYTNSQSGYAGNNDYEILPKAKCNNENIVIDVKNDTFKDKSDKNSTALLQEIVEQLNDIRENSGTYSHGLNCVINGYWKSQIGGMSLNITGYNYTHQNSTYKNITGQLTVNLFENSEKITTVKHPVLNSNWTLTGHVPHVVNETLILNAENMLNKHVAVFIGQCTFCGGSELITGQWLVHYNMKDCKNIEIGEMVRGDIFKRIHIKSEEAQLQKQ